MVYAQYPLGVGLQRISSMRLDIGVQSFDLDISFDLYQYIRVVGILRCSRPSGDADFNGTTMQIIDTEDNVPPQYWGSTIMSSGGNTVQASATSLNLGFMRGEVNPEDADYTLLDAEFWQSVVSQDTWYAKVTKINMQGAIQSTLLGTAFIDDSINVLATLRFNTNTALVIFSPFSELNVYAQ